MEDDLPPPLIKMEEAEIEVDIEELIRRHRIYHWVALHKTTGNMLDVKDIRDNDNKITAERAADWRQNLMQWELKTNTGAKRNDAAEANASA